MITFNGKNFKDFGVFVDESAAHIKPLRSYEKVSVAGRNGDLTMSNNRFENISLPFNCFIRKGYVERYAALLAFLQSVDGYHRLEMDSEPDYYREAILSEIGEPEVGAWAKSATFSLTFDCKPQRFLKSGLITHENPSALVNPTLYAAAPLIRVYGSGTLKVGTETLVIADHDHDYIDIDCDMQDCYFEATNCNSLVTMASSDFPTLHTGEIGMSFTGTKFEVTPRWWTI